MKCEKNFEKFLKNISLGETRIGRIESAVKELNEFADSDKGDKTERGIADVLIEKYIQGSYATKTGNRPGNDDEEFDVDVALNMRLEDDMFKKSSAVLSWLKRRLLKNPNYKDRLDVPCDRCVRISYKNDFHLDVVPLKPSVKAGIFLISDKTEGWNETNPKGMTEWFNRENARCEGRLYRVIKYLKWWRSAVAPEKADITSILFTVLLTNHANPKDSDAEMVVETMESLEEWLVGQAVVPEIKNPSLVSENLARNWTKVEFDAFKKSFSTATKNARAALDKVAYATSLELWQKVFGSQFEDLDGGDDKAGIYVPPQSPGRKSSREFA